MIITIDGNIPSIKAHTFTTMKMAAAFHELGEDVTVVSLLSMPNIFNRLKLGNIHTHYGINPKIKLKFLPVYNKDFFTKAIFARGFDIAFENYLKKYPPNFLYCRSYLNVLKGVMCKIPTVIETHTTLYNQPDLKKIYAIAANPYFKGLITIHDKIKLGHIERGIPENKILVVDDGVDINEFNNNAGDKNKLRKDLSLPPNQKIMTYCGSLYKEKGIEDILLTARQLMSQKVVALVVGGNQDQINSWKSYCRENQIVNVLFTGFVSHHLVPKYLKASDVLIMPYKKMDYKQMDINTTSPLKLFEYMASRVPIVSSRIPAVEKIVEDQIHALLATPDSIKDLSQNVSKLLSSPKLSDEIAENAYEKVIEFQWTTRCKKILTYFKVDQKHL